MLNPRPADAIYSLKKQVSKRIVDKYRALLDSPLKRKQRGKRIVNLHTAGSLRVPVTENTPCFPVDTGIENMFQENSVFYILCQTLSPDRTYVRK